MLYYLLFLHWIGDFVLQSNKMAVQKTKDLKYLLEHSIVYIVTFLVGLFFYYIIFTTTFDTINFRLFILANFTFHLFIDFFISKLATWYNKQKRRHAFFVVIGFGQLLHTLTILFTTQFYLQ